MKDPHQLKAFDLFSLSVFLAVATRRSFQAASVELNVTRSAVSHSVKGLENRLGVRLLHRMTRSVSLTEGGERLAVKLRPAVTSIAEALGGANDFRATPSDTVRINASDAAI